MLFKLEPPEHQRTAIRSVVEVAFLSSFSAAKEMAGSSHTPACCMSKLRNSLEAGKKQLRVWLQYVCGVKEVLFNPSYSGPLVILWSPYGDSEMARNGFMDEPSGKAEREDGSKWCATGNICSCVNEAGFVISRTYSHGMMDLYTFSGVSNRATKQRIAACHADMHLITPRKRVD